MSRGLNSSPEATRIEDNSAPLKRGFFYPGMHEIPIQFKNGLVDPNSLLEYMDGCHCGDIVQHHPYGHKVEYHHLYFPKKDYKNLKLPMPLRNLRNSKYNLIEMLSCQEDSYHQHSATEVRQGDIDLDVAETFLEEAQLVTNYASTSLMLARTSERIERSSLTRTERAQATARMAILAEMFSEDEDEMAKIEVLEHSIVVGALTNYVKQVPEDGMKAHIKSQTMEGVSIIPTKVYSERALQNIGQHRFQRRVISNNWVLRQLLEPVLSTQAA